MGSKEKTLNNNDIEHQYEKACAAAPVGARVIAQNTQRLEPFDELFYTPVTLNNKFQIQGMLDSGSMACTLSEKVEQMMLNQNSLSEPVPLSLEKLFSLVVEGHSANPAACMRWK